MTDEEHAGQGFHVDQARAMKAELERELEERKRVYPGLVKKGRLKQEEADRRIALFEEIRADLAQAFHPDIMQRFDLARSDRKFAWREKIAELRRELALRERFYPDRISKGRLTEGLARQRIADMQLVHDLFWRKMFRFEPEGELAREALAEYVRRQEAGTLKHGFQDLRESEGYAALQEEMYQHMRMIAAEPRKQAELQL